MKVILASSSFLWRLLVGLAALQPALSAGARLPYSSRTEAAHVASVLRELEGRTVGRNASVGENPPQPLCAQPEQCSFMTADSTCSNPPGQRCSQANVLYDCRACNCFCPKNQGLPFAYDFPTRTLTSFRNARCDTSNTNVPGPTPDPNKAGIYCCFQCFLWRSINTNCPATGDCWPNLGTDFNDPVVKQAQAPADPIRPHFLIIPPSQVTGIEDAQRNLVAHWTGVYNVMLFPRRYLDQSGGNNPFPGGAVPSGWSGPFPDAQQRIWIGGGINQADSRSQHQMHVHYAILPQPLRLVLTKAAWPPHPWPQGVCQDNLIVRTTNPADRRDVTFGAYFFRGSIEQAAWDPRTLAKGCANVWGQVAVPAGVDPFSADDLTMADISMMIVPGDNVTTAGQPLGYYVLLGNRRKGGFRAETMLCTQQGLDSYWLNANCNFNNWRLPVVPPKAPAENETFCPVCSQAAPINPDPSAATICESLIVTRLSKKSKGTVCTTLTVDRFHEINDIGDKVPVFRFCFASASPTAAKTCRGTADRGVLAGAFLNRTEATFGVTAGELDFSDRVNVRSMCPRQLFMSNDGTTCGDVSVRSSKHTARGYETAVIFNRATTGFKPNDAFMGCFEVRNAVRFTPPKSGLSMALAFTGAATDNGHGLRVTMGNQVCARCAENTGHHHKSGNT